MLTLFRRWRARRLLSQLRRTIAALPAEHRAQLASVLVSLSEQARATHDRRLLQRLRVIAEGIEP